MRSFIDSNLWIAAALRDGFTRRLVRGAMRQGEVVTSPELVAEVKERLKSRINVPSFVVDAVARTMTVLCDFAQWTAEKPNICRDPDDDQWLAQAEVSGCLYLVSNDMDLLVLGTFGAVRIISPSAFASILGVR